MAYKINFNATAVNNTISSLDTVYNQISEVIKDINGKKDTISSFWSCVEANSFLNVLGTVSTDFTNFEKKYTAFKTALDQVISTYEKEEEAYISKLDSMKKVNGTPTNANSGASAGDSSSS